MHSKIPFLANEGIAIEWIKGYTEIGRAVSVAFNNIHTHNDFNKIGLQNLYLPNLYRVSSCTKPTFVDYLISKVRDILANYRKKKCIDVGCFGAIRPLKNQLLQAVAAIQYADKHELVLRFHINGTRVEQRGETVLKNIRALFVNTKHELVEHKWMSHHDFLKVIKKMDIGLQLSFTESFNIVTADFVISRVPIIVGKDIEWIGSYSKCDPNNTNEMIDMMDVALHNSHYIVNQNMEHLIVYNRDSLEVWRQYFKERYHNHHQ